MGERAAARGAGLSRRAVAGVAAAIAAGAATIASALAAGGAPALRGAAQALSGAGATAAAATPDLARFADLRFADARFSDEASRVERVLALEDERLALMPAVAAWKWQHHAPVTDPGRERVVIGASVKLASPLGLDPAPIERLFELQVRLASAVEADLHRSWQARGYAFTGPVPDLGRELRPRLDRLTAELVRALYLAAPAFSRTGFEARYAPAADRQLKAAGWSAATRRELLAALGAVRVDWVHVGTGGTEPAGARAGGGGARPGEAHASGARPGKAHAGGARPGETYAGGATPALQRIRSAGVLRIGTTGDYAPFSSQEHGRLYGVDIELARALAQSLGVQPVFVRTSWPTLLDDFERGEFDVAMGGVSATAARAAAGAISVPYLSGGKTIAARCADASRLGSLAAIDRPTVRVLVNPGGTNEQFVRGHLHHARIIVDPTNATLFDELAAGRADVIVSDDTEIELQVRRHPGLCRALAGTLTRQAKVILMTRDPDLARAVNDWLRGELAAGEPARLMRSALAAVKSRVTRAAGRLRAVDDGDNRHRS